MPAFLRLFLLLAALALPGTALAAEPAKTPAPVIVVVDVQHILQESLAAKGVQQQIDFRRAQFQAETEKEENGLRQAEQELGKSRDHIAADLYAEHEQQLRQRFLGVERHVEARRKVLEQSFTDSMNTVRTSLLDIVHAAAHEHGANLVLVEQQALWADPALDITEEVLARLNKTLPQLAVKMPAVEK